MKGHTDGGTVSLLWNQPLVALQIMCPDGKWRYVKYVANSIVGADHGGMLLDQGLIFPTDRQPGRFDGDVLWGIL